ncbi:MAG: hypothetical protein K0Q85_1385, partial [Caproiciproducens sp.]|nr:hypothetical protein [Caproiciproducens sp.]
MEYYINAITIENIFGIVYGSSMQLFWQIT